MGRGATTSVAIERCPEAEVLGAAGFVRVKKAELEAA